MFSFFFHRGVIPIVVFSLIVAGSAVVFANQVSSARHVLPAFVPIYTQGATEGSDAYRKFTHVLPVQMDVNGDGLLDLVFQGNVHYNVPYGTNGSIANYDNSAVDYLYMDTRNPGRNLKWQQYVYVNTGIEFTLASKCEYFTQQEYETNCL
jgi:hypothetical protein